VAPTSRETLPFALERDPRRRFGAAPERGNDRRQPAAAYACYYFYDSSTHCNKRLPGSGCGAIGGVNRIHAILGSSDACIAVHPSDMCVALAALDAEVEVEGPKGKRLIPFALFHRLPDQTPEQDNTLELGELITAVVLPAGDFGPHHTYLKIRDRLSYAFALISVAL
jgi:xanthine dehydrogenase YagS FAD-binding subunit